MASIGETRGVTDDADSRQEDGGGTIRSVIYNRQVILVDSDEEDMCRYKESVFPLYTSKNIGHRSGSIYTSALGKMFGVSDRRETQLEATMNSDPTADCFCHNGICIVHPPRCMLQIFSLRLAKVPSSSGSSLELYGYIAVRDNLDRLLNYVVSYSRDDPVVVEQGSLITMNGPKRAIHLLDTIVIEYDMRIKTGQDENDDLQLIDGLSAVDGNGVWDSRTLARRIHGDCGAVDMVFLRLRCGVEATVQVSVSQVKCGFSLRLGCFVNRLDEEICLFDGAIIGESGILHRSVVAVIMDSWMNLKFMIGSESSTTSAQVCCSFRANNHGISTQHIKTHSALISIKVTWSTLSLCLDDL
ncbi:uncharacterized protein LOC124672013 [Lolium rigidum]|uniref:uncharacterized protein LOC124672013 n=1 Tax=Lolium rigidum TaxID=89674 RepID=UPI001F5C77F7|nr:uncharacterized protein LOC124672013 [Lolium rigidum]